MTKSISEPRLIELDINKIELLEKNPRKISKKEFRALCDDIKNDPNFLKQRPPLINEVRINPMNAVLKCYAGTQRVKAARELGYTMITCWVEENVPQKLQDARMLKDNLHRGEWDMDLLKDFDPSFLHDAGFKF